MTATPGPRALDMDAMSGPRALNLGLAARPCHESLIIKYKKN